MSVEKRMQMLSLYWILISLRLLNVRGKGKKWTLKLITLYVLMPQRHAINKSDCRRTENISCIIRA